MVDFECAEIYDIQALKQIIARLRAPDGCPWDREQTHQSIRRNLLEEAYEVAEAIDEADPAHLKEELGDLLLQVVFHAQMAQEEGQFALEDVIDGVAKKMVFRHPHVFGSVQTKDTAQAIDTWEAQKQLEKAQHTVTDTLHGVSRALPALIRAEKVQKKAANAGASWSHVSPALEKVREETEEFCRAVQGDGDPAEELGDLLFAAVKAGSFCGLDGEQALHGACEKFIARFARMEQLAQGVPFSQMDEEGLEALWQQAKEGELTP